MPLYEYACDACGHRFEIIQKFSDAPIEKCPKCGSAVRKLMSSPAIQFKGSGWYITDYAKKDSTSTTKGGSAKDGSTSGSDVGSGDAKPSDTPATPAPAASSGAKSD